MINGKRLVIIMPAFNASKTLKNTYSDIPHHVVDDIILVDDKSSDNTIEIAKELKIQHIIAHDINKGYGANQKTCFDYALKLNADIVILLHPDYQYNPKLIVAIGEMISCGIYDIILASRILCGSAIKGGMPVYKYFANRFLTLFQNIFLNQKLSEYHTGYRAYSKEVLGKLKYHQNSDNFIFDNQIISQSIMHNFRIGEISCPAKYSPDSSSINFKKSVNYGLGVIYVTIEHLFHKWNLIKNNRYN